MDKKSQEKTMEFLTTLLGAIKTLGEEVAKDNGNNLENHKMIDRIILIGSHGTGKTTLANALQNELNLPVTESVARALYKNVVFENYKPTNYDMQDLLCKMSLWDFTRWKCVPNIMTRCPLDTLAYTKVLSSERWEWWQAKKFEHLYKQHLDELKKNQEAMDMLESSLFVYLPIEFNLENDGMRPVDCKYQKAVDKAMRELIYEFGITPLVVSGTVEERTKKVLDFIEKL